MILDGLGVPFRYIDISIRGKENERDFMRKNAVKKERENLAPQPPQFFFKEEYLGVLIKKKKFFRIYFLEFY